MLSPGDKVWYLVCGELIVEATVVEIASVGCKDRGNADSPSCWHFRSLVNGVIHHECRMHGRDATPEEMAWPEGEYQGIYIDEPVGHEVDYGTTAYNDCFPTLQHALNVALPTRRKRLKARLHKWRNQCKRAIAKTHGVRAWQKPWPIYPKKRVYVHTGKVTGGSKC